MPIYEYRCRQCGKQTSRLMLSIHAAKQQSCRYCQSRDLERLMSRFSAPKSEEARLEALADPSHLGGLDENDPQSMARFMKKMGEEMGEDVGDDVEAAMDDGQPPPTDMGSTDFD